MISHKWSNRIVVILVAGMMIPGIRSSAQNLYSQTSEMADIMINYDADKASIRRFYATGPQQQGFGQQQQGANYNSPERRKRLLQLIDEYGDKLKKQSFDKWNINGKVDYILFKRNLESDQYELLEEQKVYDQVAQYLPFSDRIYTLQKPRRRGLAVKGEEVAKELNDINKEIAKSLSKLKTGKPGIRCCKGIAGNSKRLF